ncbi:MAG: Hsp70 family protein, partial [Planctomycetes bacterium]|nr:Hsp70 family protein [Planctomycetota bacterium]
RSEFIDLIMDGLNETIDCIDKALKDAKLETKDIDSILLVGGPTRIPAVWDMVGDHLNQDPHSEIDPDGTVALGAAVQAGIISGDEIDAILVDVTPLTLGIEVADITYVGHVLDDRFAPLIHRNTTIPVQKSKVFTTLYPQQDKIEIKVYQGENQTASRNTLLGEFTVENLKPNRPDGLTEVTVNFVIDVNGILDVTVKERKTGKRISRQMKANRQKLSPEQIA